MLCGGNKKVSWDVRKKKPLGEPCGESVGLIGGISKPHDTVSVDRHDVCTVPVGTFIVA